MSTEASRDVRELLFVSSTARKEYEELPQEVQDIADAFTTTIQNNGRLPPKSMKVLKGSLEGISEVRVGQDKDTYRIYDLMTFP